MNQNPTPEAVTATPNSKEPTMSLDNLTEQPTITAPDEPALPASTNQPDIAAPTAIATSPAEPDDGDATSHNDPSPLGDRPCADQSSPVDSDDTAPARCRTPASTPAHPARAADRSTRLTSASDDAEPSADIEDAERSADAGVAHRVLVIGVAAILVVVALVGRRRRGRAGVSP